MSGFFSCPFNPPLYAIARARSARPSSSSSARAPSARGSQSNPAQRQKIISRSIFVRFGRSLHQNALEFGAEFKKAIPQCLQFTQTLPFSIFSIHPPLSLSIFPNLQAKNQKINQIAPQIKNSINLPPKKSTHRTKVPMSQSALVL